MADADASLDIAVRVKNAQEVKQTLGGIQRETSKSSRATVKAARQEAEDLKRIRISADRDRRRAARENTRTETMEAQAASKARIAAMQAESKALDESYAKQVSSIRNMVNQTGRLERSGDDLVTRSRLANIKRFELAKTKSEDYITRRVQAAVRQRAQQRGGTAGGRAAQATLPSVRQDQRRAMRGAIAGAVLGAGVSIARTGIRESVNPDPGDADFFQSVAQLRSMGGGGRAGKLSDEAVGLSQSGETSILSSDMVGTAASAVSRHGVQVFDMLEGRLAQLAQVADATGRPFDQVVENFIQVAKAVDATDKDLDGLIQTIGDRAASGGGGNLFAVLTGLSGTDKPLINLKRMMPGQGAEGFGGDAATVVSTLLAGGASPSGAQSYVEKLAKSIKQNRKTLDMSGGLVGVVEQLSEQGKLPKDPRTERFQRSINEGDLRKGPGTAAADVLTEMLTSAHFEAKTNKAKRQADTFATDDFLSRTFGPPAERSQGFYNLFSGLGDALAEVPILQDLGGATGGVAMTALGFGMGPWLLKKLGIGGLLSGIGGLPGKSLQSVGAIAGTGGMGGIGGAGLGLAGFGAAMTTLLSLIPSHQRTLGPNGPSGIAGMDYVGPYSPDAMRDASMRERMFVGDRPGDTDAIVGRYLTSIEKLERAIRENTTSVREKNDGVPFYLRHGG